MVMFSKFVVSVAALLAAVFALSPSAFAATHHTAGSCSGHSSNGQCLNGPNGLHAWDALSADNHTLDDWAYPGGQVEIANHLSSVTIYPTSCFVQYYSGENNSGKSFKAYSYNQKRTTPVPSGFGAVKSFRWFC